MPVNYIKTVKRHFFQ